MCGLVLFALRAVTFGARHFILEQGTLAGLQQTGPTVLLYLFGETLLLSSLLFILWGVAGKASRLVEWLVVLVFPGVLLLTIADMIVFHIIGDRLTPSVLKQFVGIHLFIDTDFTEPVLGNLPSVLGGLALVIVFLICVGNFVLDAGQANGKRTAHVKAGMLWLVLSAAALAGAFRSAPMSSDRPILAAFTQELLGIDGVMADNGAIQRLRDFTGLPDGRQWADDRTPLVHVAAAPEPQPAYYRPDIFLVLIESLRGEDVGFNNPGRPSATPELDALASGSVVFPGFISNGFPSGPGFTSTTCSTWPHYRRRIVVDFRNTHFDCLPTRLSSLGYRTVAIEFEPGNDGTRDWLARLYDDLIETARQGEKSDKRIFEMAMDRVRRHEATERDRPLFMYIKTKTPHLPYFTPSDGGGPPDGATATTLRRNYLHNLAYVDRHLGRFVRFLQGRRRAKDTVIVVHGDHANYLDQTASTGLPVNDNVWTSMVLNAPTHAVGGPRMVREPASQVDILPTLAGIIGDKRPMGSPGRDLFNPSGRPAMAVALRGGGARLDRDGFSLVQPRNKPELSTVSRFSALARAKEAGDAFSRREREGFYELLLTWSYLVENNMVWRPELLKSGDDGSQVSD